VAPERGARSLQRQIQQTQPSSSKVGATSSDEEDNGDVQVEDNTPRRRRTTLAEAQESKSSLLDSGTRELAEHSQGPLPSHSIWELAGSPGGSLPSASVRELAEQNMVDDSLEELGQLAAELNRQLEL